MAIKSRRDSVEYPRVPVAWVPKSPDGGWGWVVVVGSFLIHVLTDGIVYSFGIMVVEFLKTFQEGRGLTSWIVSILVGMTLGVGPIASAVTNRFGCRVATITGAVIASIGCASCYFATSVLYLMISVGLVVGFGFGLIYCPAIIIVTMYFEDRRALATGLAVCGAGVGTFIFAPFSSFLIDTYTWRGAFLIYSGLVLNCAVCGALFRPLEFVPIYERREPGAPAVANASVECINESTNLVHESKNNLGNGFLESLEKLEPASENQKLLENGKSDINHSSSSFGLLRNDQENPKFWREVRSNTVTGGVEESIQLRKSLLATRQRIKGVSESTGYLNIPDVFYFGSITSMPGSHRRQAYRSMTALPRAAFGAVLERTDSEGHIRVIVSRPPSPQRSIQEEGIFHKLRNANANASDLDNSLCARKSPRGNF